MKATYSFKGYCEARRVRQRNWIARHKFGLDATVIDLQVGPKKEFADDVPVQVTLTVETIEKKRKSK